MSSMKTVDVVVVGGGHAGLTLSTLLKNEGRDHVVLEKSRVLEQWKSARWESFKLNTPMFVSRLPGQTDDLEDFRTGLPLKEVLESWENHVKSHQLPVREHTRVVSVSKNAPAGSCEGTDSSADFLYVTAIGNDGDEQVFRARNVVSCSGAFGSSQAPDIAQGLPKDGSIVQVKVGDGYDNPESLPEGATLVVGGGQSGMQIANELARAGRDVYVATSKVQCCPRSHRGEDLFVWLDRIGFLKMPTEAAPPPMLNSRNPITGADCALSHHHLAKMGVKLLGSLQGFESSADDGSVKAKFVNNLKENVEIGEEGYHKMVGIFENFVKENFSDSYGEHTVEPEWAEKHQPLLDAMENGTIPTELDLKALGITSVVWATGFKCDLSYVPDEVAASLRDCGMPQFGSMKSSVDGFYWLGFPWLQTTMSLNIVGFEHDARMLLRLLRPASIDSSAKGATLGMDAVAASHLEAES